MSSTQMRDFTLLIFLLLILAYFAYSFFGGYSGCRGYADDLRNCKVSSCTQKVKGFQGGFGSVVERSISRKIIGTQRDKFYDEDLCHVIEDDGDNQKYDCVYHSDEKQKMVIRSGILFGNDPVDVTANNKSVSEDSIRASNLNRVDAQNKSCTKL